MYSCQASANLKLIISYIYKYFNLSRSPSAYHPFRAVAAALEHPPRGASGDRGACARPALRHGASSPAQFASRSIAVFDPRLGAVLVASHHPNWLASQVIDVDIPPRTTD
ncbi:CRISPR-associated protein Csx3 [Gemmata algarum]|uniref:CRISPR-associated protein Csx3 n=1 Tax=Gemmata algarum TaxID=2975278 RepID=UPI0039C9AE7D